jgi:hypothetical protein
MWSVFQALEFPSRNYEVDARSCDRKQTTAFLNKTSLLLVSRLEIKELLLTILKSQKFTQVSALSC